VIGSLAPTMAGLVEGRAVAIRHSMRLALERTNSRLPGFDHFPSRSGVVVREAARELAGGRPLFLTLTHFHPEHGYGAQAFRDAATIIYNREQHDEFLQKSRPYLDMFRGLGSEIAEQLEGVECVDPHVAYEGAANIDLGGKVVQLRTWGTAHSRGDQTVYLPDEHILFTNDPLLENS
jgi:glyoxylase-like metal-dependent hydrolase (beta-lactamase superfamily II)